MNTDSDKKEINTISILRRQEDLGKEKEIFVPEVKQEPEIVDEPDDEIVAFSAAPVVEKKTIPISKIIEIKQVTEKNHEKIPEKSPFSGKIIYTSPNFTPKKQELPQTQTQIQTQQQQTKSTPIILKVMEQKKPDELMEETQKPVIEEQPKLEIPKLEMPPIKTEAIPQPPEISSVLKDFLTQSKKPEAAKGTPKEVYEDAFDRALFG